MSLINTPFLSASELELNIDQILDRAFSIVATDAERVERNNDDVMRDLIMARRLPIPEDQFTVWRVSGHLPLEPLMMLTAPHRTSLKWLLTGEGFVELEPDALHAQHLAHREMLLQDPLAAHARDRLARSAVTGVLKQEEGMRMGPA